MAPKLWSLNSLIDRNGRNKPKDKTHELAIVKAAAWAWYQHGSGSEGKATSEFDATRTHRAPGPSRYKLEAMKLMAQEAKEGSPVHSNKSLLDSYEVHSISMKLDSLIESSHNKLSNNSANSSLENCGGRMKKKKKVGKGFWQRHGVICGTREDVVELSAKRVPAVNMAKCLPLPRANSTAL